MGLSELGQPRPSKCNRFKNHVAPSMLTIFGAYIHLLRIKQTFPAESKHTKNTKWLLGRAPFFRCPEGWVVGYHCDYHNDMNTCINITFNITIINTTIIIIVVIIIIIIMIIIMIIFFFIIITIVTANTTITTITIFAVPLNLLMSSGNLKGDRATVAQNAIGCCSW